LEVKLTELKVGEKTYTLKKIGYIDGIELDEIKTTQGAKVFAKKILMLGCNISEEDVLKLSLSEGMALQRSINSYNSLDVEDFQEPTKLKQN